MIESKRVRIISYVDVDISKRLKIQGCIERKSMSEIIDNLVREYLDKVEDDKR